MRHCQAVRSQKRRISREDLETLPVGPGTEVLDLVVLLRLAILLHRSRGVAPVPTPGLSRQGKRWTLRFRDGWLDRHALTRADLLRETEDLAAVGLTLEITGNGD